MDENNDMPAEESASPAQETVPNLKALREAGGLSLPDIFETTRVSLIYLAAVESGEFNRLPPSVYARDFIRKYARTVGIDEKPILNRYEKYLESLKPIIKETEIQKPWPETGGRNRFLFASLAAVIIAGLAPILWSHGAGADVMKRIATPMVGGVITSTLMELLVYPAIYYLWRSRQVKQSAVSGQPLAPN